MATELEIELKPQIAQQFVRELGKEIDIEVGQYSVVVNGREVAYVCYADGSPINFLPAANHWPANVLKQIADAARSELTRLHGESERKSFDPPSQEVVEEAEKLAGDIDDRNTTANAADENNL